MASVTLSLLCIVTICFRMTLSVPFVNFFPLNRTTILLRADEDDKDLILTQDIVFFNISYRTINLRTNGILILGPANNATRLPIGEFPQEDHLPVIAPFWGDVDNSIDGSGTIDYHVTSNADVIQKVKDIVTNAFPIESDFTAIEVIVVTWDQVGYYDQRRDKRNTFQCVVATDGTRTFAIFLYSDNEINWTTGDGTIGGGGTDGVGGIPAQAGFDAGDGLNCLSLEGSNTDDVINIVEKSNVDIPGLFVFQINDVKIRSPPTCPAVGTTACKDSLHD